MSNSFTNATPKSLAIIPATNNFAGQGRSRQGRTKKQDTALVKEVLRDEKVVRRQSRKAKGKGEKQAKAKAPACEMTPQCMASHMAAMRYLKACGNPNIRGVIPAHTNNPLQSPYAVPFMTEATFKQVIGPGTMTYAFPLGFGVDSPLEGIDGAAFHSSFAQVGSTQIYSTGPCPVIDGSGATRLPAAAWYFGVIGTDSFPTSSGTIGTIGINWDLNFPIPGDLRAASFTHVRWALVSARVEFYCDTAIANRGGYFNVFEPRTRNLPMIAGASTLTGSAVRELPSFRSVPFDEKIHRHTVQGREGSRDYWHNADSSVSGATGSTSPISSGLYLQAVNTSAVNQSVGWRIVCQWAVAGQSVEGLATPTTGAGIASNLITNTLEAAANGTVNIVSAAAHAIGNVVAPSARTALLKDINSRDAGEGFSALSPANLAKMLL